MVDVGEVAGRDFTIPVVQMRVQCILGDGNHLYRITLVAHLDLVEWNMALGDTDQVGGRNREDEGKDGNDRHKTDKTLHGRGRLGV